MSSTSSNSNVNYLTQIQKLADSIENVWSSISPEARKNEVLRMKYLKLKALKNRLKIKIQGDLKNENTK